jgi:DNA-binding response OmpR family regulator
MCRENDFDILVIDLLMPERDGTEVINELHRKKYPARIIAMSGGDATYNSQLYLGISRKLGADRILKKPFTFNMLSDCIRSIVPETG